MKESGGRTLKQTWLRVLVEDGGRAGGGGVLDYKEKIAKRSEEHSRRPARTAEKARDKRKEPLPTPSRKMKLLSSDAEK